MKGGYQIIDLTGATSGDPVTIKGIFDSIKGNNGKPVMVLANDGQRVFAQTKKSSTNYVLTYLSGEGKTVKVTISNADAVTTVIEDDAASIEALEQAVNEISTDVQTLQKVGVSATFTEVADENSTFPVTFTCTSDGYVRHYNNSLPSAGIVQSILCKDNGDPSYCVIGDLNSGAATGGTSTYVRKGQKIIVNNPTALTGGSFNVRFYPFED